MHPAPRSLHPPGKHLKGSGTAAGGLWNGTRRRPLENSGGCRGVAQYKAAHDLALSVPRAQPCDLTEMSNAWRREAGTAAAPAPRPCVAAGHKGGHAPAQERAHRDEQGHMHPGHVPCRLQRLPAVRAELTDFADSNLTNWSTSKSACRCSVIARARHGRTGCTVGGPHCRVGAPVVR